jgi:hypothetical protein
MKTKIFSILLTVAAMVGFSACSDDWNPDAEGSGQLRTASLGVEVDGAETIVSDNSGAKKSIKAVSSRATIDLSNFIVAVSTSAGKEVERWTYSTMPELPTFAAGEYTVTVKSHEVEPAAWNAPYYEGTQTFTIVANQITEVETVVCKLANIRVSVAFTDDLLAAFDNANEVSVKVSIDNAGTNSLTFTPSETRSGYFQALSDLQTLRIDFSASILGNVETFTKTIDNVAKGQHRKITFGLTSNPNLPPDELGTIINDGQGITIDNTVDEDDPIETNFDWYEDNTNSNGRPGDEDFDDGDKPGQGGEETTEVIRFESSSLDLVGENDATSFPSDGSKPADVDIYADNGFAHLLVEIISDDLTDEMLTSVGLAATFDLAYPGNLEDKLSDPDGFNFPVGDNIIGQTHVNFNIAPFVPLLNMYPGNVHKFRITATDQQNNQKSVTLTFRT